MLHSAGHCEQIRLDLMGRAAIGEVAAFLCWKNSADKNYGGIATKALARASRGPETTAAKPRGVLESLQISAF